MRKKEKIDIKNVLETEKEKTGAILTNETIEHENRKIFAIENKESEFNIKESQKMDDKDKKIKELEDELSKLKSRTQNQTELGIDQIKKGAKNIADVLELNDFINSVMPGGLKFVKATFDAISTHNWSCSQNTILINNKPIYILTFDNREYILYPTNDIVLSAYDPCIIISSHIPKYDPNNRKIDMNSLNFSERRTFTPVPEKTKPVYIFALGAIAFYDEEDLIIYKSRTSNINTPIEKFNYGSVGKFLTYPACGTILLNLSEHDYYTTFDDKIIQIPKAVKTEFVQYLDSEEEIAQLKNEESDSLVIIYMGIQEKLDHSANLFNIMDGKFSKDDVLLKIISLDKEARYQSDPIKLEDVSLLIFSNVDSARGFIEDPVFKGDPNRFVIGKIYEDLDRSIKEINKDQDSKVKARSKSVAATILTILTSGAITAIAILSSKHIFNYIVKLKSVFTLLVKNKKTTGKVAKVAASALRQFMRL